MIAAEFKPTSRGYMHGTVAKLGDKKVEILRYDTCHAQWQVFCYVNKELQPQPDDNPDGYTHQAAVQIAQAFLRGNQA